MTPEPIEGESLEAYRLRAAEWDRCKREQRERKKRMALARREEIEAAHRAFDAVVAGRFVTFAAEGELPMRFLAGGSMSHRATTTRPVRGIDVVGHGDECGMPARLVIDVDLDALEAGYD